MQTITSSELKEWIELEKHFILIDVRERHERDAFHIGGKHIPLAEVMQHREVFRSEGAPVVVYCEKGIRSGIVIQRLNGLGFSNLYNLSGGMQAWREEGTP